MKSKINTAYTEALKIKGVLKTKRSNIGGVQGLTIFVKMNADLAEVSKTFNEIFILADSLELKALPTKNTVYITQ